MRVAATCRGKELVVGWSGGVGVLATGSGEGMPEKETVRGGG